MQRATGVRLIEAPLRSVSANALPRHCLWLVRFGDGLWRTCRPFEPEIRPPIMLGPRWHRDSGVPLERYECARHPSTFPVLPCSRRAVRTIGKYLPEASMYAPKSQGALAAWEKRRPRARVRNLPIDRLVISFSLAWPPSLLAAKRSRQTFLTPFRDFLTFVLLVTVFELDSLVGPSWPFGIDEESRT